MHTKVKSLFYLSDMIILIIVLFLIATLGLFLRDQYMERQRKDDLKKIQEKIDEILDNTPCDVKCVICRLTGQACPGRKKCLSKKHLML